MKAMVLYFSGTGNTLYVVNRIKGILNKENCATQIHSMEEEVIINPDEFDLLILGSPKYYEYPVLDFIKYIKRNLPTNKKTIPTMFFCTQVSPLETNFNEIEYILEKKNYKLIVSKSIPIANNMIIFNSFPLTEQKKVSHNLEQLDRELPYLLTCLMTGEVKKEKPNSFLGGICRLSGYSFTKLFQWFAVKYSSTDACTGCGVCARKCPKKNIVMQDQRPRFGNDCIFCMRCINRCPSNAILYNNKACNQYSLKKTMKENT